MVSSGFARVDQYARTPKSTKLQEVLVTLQVRAHNVEVEVNYKLASVVAGRTKFTLNAHRFYLKEVTKNMRGPYAQWGGKCFGSPPRWSRKQQFSPDP